ncbi:MAG: carbamoyl-phosphate synthase large subunit [Deltaproteobacteria bacterium]|nr:carbamoyl-phosphate synthase large subunit [Deltaproteobacteria bacterium]
MTDMRLLAANRGEIAVRILRAAAEMGIYTVAVYSEDDSRSLHIKKADEARALRGQGAAAYLDIEQIIGTAKASGCNAIHPGYGFLSENAAFARRCEEEGIVFVGPRAELLDLFGHKLQAKAAARQNNVPVLPGTYGATTVNVAQEFRSFLPEGSALMIKAVAGGGGRCIKEAWQFEDIETAVNRCRFEAQQAFGNGDVYVEQLIPRARHIEVQIIGDGTGAVSHLWERECSIQRRHQKLIECAPSPGLPEGLRQNIIDAACRLAANTRYNNLGTFEFLVDVDDIKDDGAFAFIEVNPRLQVEHTVTEEATGLDLVQIQLRLAQGATIAELGLEQNHIPRPKGFAIQARVNMETMDKDGVPQPAGGILSAFEIPSGAGIRTDTFGYRDYQTSARYDSLLAKVICHTHSDRFSEAVNKLYRALGEFRIAGVPTNIPFLQNILSHDAVRAGDLYTRFMEDHAGELLAQEDGSHRRLYFENDVDARFAGAAVDDADPLAVLQHGKATRQLADDDASSTYIADETAMKSPDGLIIVRSRIQGTIWKIEKLSGDTVQAGEIILIMEAMKMEHELQAPVSGIIRRMTVAVGDAVYAGHPLVLIEEAETETARREAAKKYDLNKIRPDLKEVLDRHAATADSARPDAVERRRATGQRTARENLEDLCDPGSFVEYGSLVLPLGMRRSLDELITRYPGDGMYVGLASVNGDLFEETAARCAVLSYDYTVLAGTQGGLNHRKTDRILDVAEQLRVPVIFFTEGGGGRAGGGGAPMPASTPGGPVPGGGTGGLDIPSWRTLSQLSGLVPVIGVNSGYCFAGNAMMLGCCDVIIATANSRIGVGGPAMIEGGGLGVFHPDEVGPMSVQAPNGVVDVAVKDEAEAVGAAKKYLSYFQGTLKTWEAADQRILRHIIPENRLRVYDPREIIETMADTGSVLELRKYFGLGMITALIRIEGRPLGLIANNPSYLSGAIDAPGADKAARFMQLCDAFDLPIVFLCDTPGIMVGPEIEKTALVRHACRMFVTGASLTVPTITVILRKGYGLGAMTMGGGHFKAPAATVAWPTGEFGGMGLEGQVKLGFRTLLADIKDADERNKKYAELVEMAYQRGKAMSAAVSFGIDDAIDPADTRRIVRGVLKSASPPERRSGKKRPLVDTW